MASRVQFYEQAPALERVLPSGRTLVLRVGEDGEDIEIRSRGGAVDLRITMTDAGPVVSLRGARLELDAADVAVRCRNFEVEASGELRLASDGQARIEADEVRAEARHDVHLNGAFIRLNCTPEGEAEAQALLAAQRSALPPAGEPEHHHEPAAGSAPVAPTPGPR